nr:EOG090X05S8 [Macrothrix elegans]
MLRLRISIETVDIRSNFRYLRQCFEYYCGQLLVFLGNTDNETYRRRLTDLAALVESNKLPTLQSKIKQLAFPTFILYRSKELGQRETVETSSTIFKLNFQLTSFPLTLDIIPIVPPLESFCHFDKSEVRTNFFQSVKVGDLLVGQIQQKAYNGVIFKLIATDIGTRLRDVRELGIKGTLHPDYLAAADRKDSSLNVGDYVRCEVVDVSADSEKLICGTKGVHQPPGKTDVQLGVITKEQMPKSFRVLNDLNGKSYEECLLSNRAFRNPSVIEHLSNSLGLNASSTIPDSFLSGLNAQVSPKDFADELRKTQNGKWAQKSVAEGIKYFKAGLETEAFQCLNKALHIDPVNVDGLVARGALYANKGSYEKAVTDFEAALKERPNHTNATNYLSETLVAYAKQFEDEKNIDAAMLNYQKCLNLNPNHVEARASLQQLSKNRQRPNFNIDFLEVENGTGPKGATGRSADEAEEKNDGKKSRRHRKRNKRGSSSSSSRSGSSSSSRFSSSGSESSNGRSRSKKSRRSKKTKHEPSLSPFSKKMAQLNPSSVAASNSADTSVVAPAPPATFYPSTEYPSISTAPHPVPPPAFGAVTGNAPPSGFGSYGAASSTNQPPGYDREVQDFIQRTSLNSEYEKKVELFLQHVGKSGKDGEKKEKEEKEKDKEKKKKKKKDRSKDKKKKDGKREKSKDKKHKKKKKGSDDEDSEKIASPNLSGLDELGELEAKLSAVYNKLTAKDSSKKKKKRKRHSSNSSDSSSSSGGSSSDSELERKKRKAKKALEDLAVAAGLLRSGEVAPIETEEDYAGKWRPMALKVKLGRASDEPEVEESRMVYMKEERKAAPLQQVPPALEAEEELPPGEDKVSFQIKSFGLFGPGSRQGAPKPVSPPKQGAEQDQAEVLVLSATNKGKEVDHALAVDDAVRAQSQAVAAEVVEGLIHVQGHALAHVLDRTDVGARVLIQVIGVTFSATVVAIVILIKITIVVGDIHSVVDTTIVVVVGTTTTIEEATITARIIIVRITIKAMNTVAIEGEIGITKLRKTKLKKPMQIRMLKMYPNLHHHQKNQEADLLLDQDPDQV